MAEQKTLEQRVEELEKIVDEYDLMLSDIQRDINFLEDMWRELRYE